MSAGELPRDFKRNSITLEKITVKQSPPGYPDRRSIAVITDHKNDLIPDEKSRAS
jgi:hypothetical protein